MAGIACIFQSVQADDLLAEVLPESDSVVLGVQAGGMRALSLMAVEVLSVSALDFGRFWRFFRPLPDAGLLRS